MIIFRQKLFRNNYNKKLKNRYMMKRISKLPEELSAANSRYPIIKGGVYNDSEFFQKKNKDKRGIAILQLELIQKSRGYGENDTKIRKNRSLNSSRFLLSKEAKKSHL